MREKNHICVSMYLSYRHYLLDIFFIFLQLRIDKSSIAKREVSMHRKDYLTLAQDLYTMSLTS